MNPREVRELYQYNSWANHRVLEACSALTGEQFARQLGSSFSSVRDTVVHIMGAEWLWLERWQGRSPLELPFAELVADLAEAKLRWAQIEREQISFVSGLSDADLARVFEYRNLRGNRYAYPLGTMLKHVVNHSTYHRGQITTMLRQLGVAPLSTDLLRYYDFLAGDPEE